MSPRRSTPALIPWLTAVTGIAPVLVMAAMALTRFGRVDLSITYDLLTWMVARNLAWVGLLAAVAVVVLAFRDLKGRGVYAVIALVLGVGAVAVFQMQAQRLAQPTSRDISTHASEPPPFNRLAALHRDASRVTGPETCEEARSIPSQLLAQQAVSALVDAGFPVVRASTFDVEGVHEGAWFGFGYDAVVRIRPGRTDVRVAARDTRPDGGATCRLMAKIVQNLEAKR